MAPLSCCTAKPLTFFVPLANCGCCSAQKMQVTGLSVNSLHQQSECFLLNKKKEKQLMMCKFGLYSGRLFIQTIGEEEAVKILIREKSLKEKGVT